MRAINVAVGGNAFEGLLDSLGLLELAVAHIKIEVAVIGNAIGNRAALDDSGGHGGAQLQIVELCQLDLLISHLQYGVPSAEKVVTGMCRSPVDSQFAFAAALASDADIIVRPSGLHIEAAEGALCQADQQLRGIGIEMALVLIAGEDKLHRAFCPAQGLKSFHHPDGNDNTALHIQAAQTIGFSLAVHPETRGTVPFIVGAGDRIFHRGGIDCVIMSAEQHRLTGTLSTPDSFQGTTVDRPGIVGSYSHSGFLQDSGELFCHPHGSFPVSGLDGCIDKILPHGKNIGAMGVNEFKYLGIECFRSTASFIENYMDNTINYLGFSKFS